MILKPNYFIIPFITICVALLGSVLTSYGMQWYDGTLVKPLLTPPKWVFPLAWNLIFLCATISALIIWNKAPAKRSFFTIFSGKKLSHSASQRFLIILFIVNALLNVLWSYLFFSLHAIAAAFVEMLLLELSLILMIPLAWQQSRVASILLIPYFLWVGFATYLTFVILSLN